MWIYGDIYVYMFGMYNIRWDIWIYDIWDLGHYSLVENGLKGWYWFWSNNLQKKLLFYQEQWDIQVIFCWRRRNCQIPQICDIAPLWCSSCKWSKHFICVRRPQLVPTTRKNLRSKCRFNAGAHRQHWWFTNIISPVWGRDYLSGASCCNGMFLAWWQQLRKLQCPESEYKTWNSPQHLHPQSSSAPSGIYKLLLDTTTLFLYKARRPLSKQAPSWCQETAPNFQTGRATPKCMKWGHALHFL